MEGQAESYAKRIESNSDLFIFDADNLRLIADELGATPEQFVGFLEVTKAIYNGGKVENEIYIRGHVSDSVKATLIEQGEQRIIEENQ